MAELERIVRPFETRVLTPASQGVSSGAPPQNIVLQYGKSSGSAETTQGHYEFSTTSYMKKTWSEFTIDPSADPFSSEGIGYEPVHFF
jgi:hypothetical protein